MTETELATLQTTYSGTMFSVAMSVTREVADAEEVVSDAFMKAWADAARFDSARGSMLAWLLVLTRSRALDMVRARNRRHRALDRAAVEFAVHDEASRAPAVALRSMEAAEVRVALTQAIGTLPAVQRQVIELAFLHGASHVGVSRRLGVPLGTVKTRARLGLRKLRTVLAAP